MFEAMPLPFRPLSTDLKRNFAARCESPQPGQTSCRRASRTVIFGSPRLVTVPGGDEGRMGKKNGGGIGRPIPAAMGFAVTASALEDVQRELRTLVDELRSAANQCRGAIRVATDDVATASAATRRLLDDVTREAELCRAEARGIRASSAAFADAFDAQQRAYLEEL